MLKYTYSPICLFTYKRLEETKQAIDALQKNYLAKESELFIFSDGFKNNMEAEKVNEVRKYLRSITGFKKITLFESKENKGLANSIISGVTQIIEQYGKVIVLEDDLITTPNFLDFMNQALNFYQNDTQIHSISSYTLNLPSLKNYSKDYYFGYRASSWGWGTWKERWEKTDWEVKTYSKFKHNPIQQFKFMRGGSDMPRMLKNQMKGKIDSWAIRWCFDQFLKNQLTIFPSKSKILNIGVGENATHTKYLIDISNPLMDKGKKNIFKFDKKPNIDTNIVCEFRSAFSYINRIKRKYYNK